MTAPRSPRADWEAMRDERDQWRARWAAENAARVGAEDRFWFLSRAILAAGAIAALCGTLHAAEAASHAVAAHNVDRQEQP